jgi:hypothetical protein
MPKYLLAYHGGSMPETEEEGARVMAAWTSWMGGLGDAIADGGNPIGPAATIAPDGAVTPGGGANPVTGYSVITAGDLDEAVALTKDCPILASGGSVEVGETFDVM